MKSPGIRFAYRSLLPAALVSIVLLAGCAQGPKRLRAQRVPVAVATAQQRSVPLTLDATGTVEAIQVANVGSQVGGTVQRIAFREGAEVRRGQVLIQLDPRPFRTVLDQALATLQRDRAQAEKAGNDASRAQKLFEQNVIAQADWDQARATAEAAAATVHSDTAAVNAAQLNLQYASIRAPIGGRTGKLQVHVGDLVKAATTDPLVTVNQTEPVRVAFTVPESSVPLVQRYRDSAPQVWVKSRGTDSLAIEGRLAFVDNAVDATSGTLLLKGEFPNRDRQLWPGQFVQVRLVLAHQPGMVTVPAPAVVNGQQGTYVYVLNRDSTTKMQPVKVDRSDDVIAVIASGLQPGETVVTDGQFRIGPGAKVLVRQAAGSGQTQ